MIAKIRELNLNDLKTVSGGVSIPTKQQVIANSMSMHGSVNVPTGANAALARPTPSAALAASTIRFI